jgi:hypothetical protein
MSNTFTVIIIAAIVIVCVWLTLRDLCKVGKGVGEQSDESKKMIERENEMLMSRMIDYSENANK